MNTQSISTPTLRALLLTLTASFFLTGCFVGVPDSDYERGYEDGYHDSEDDFSSGSRGADLPDHHNDHEERVIDEERTEFEDYEEFEEFEEYEETTTTTTTTTTEDTPNLNPQSPVAPPILFEDTFESPSFEGTDRITVTQLSKWAIEWAPGSACELFEGTASVELQREADLGGQFEVEGLQHLRLDGLCGSDRGTSRLLTSISGLHEATTLVFYARSAQGEPDAELEVEFGPDLVMSEPLLSGWAEYTIDLASLSPRDEEIIIFTALTPGVLIDHVRIF